MKTRHPTVNGGEKKDEWTMAHVLNQPEERKGLEGGNGGWYNQKGGPEPRRRMGHEEGERIKRGKSGVLKRGTVWQEKLSL